MKKTSLSLMVSLILVTGCGSDSNSNNSSNGSTTNAGVSLPVIQGSAIGSATFYSTVPEEFAVEGIDRYVKLTPRSNVNRSSRSSSSEPAINIIAADDGVDGEKIRRAVMIMQHLLTDYAGSTYGADKTSIATSMAERNATLMLTANDEDNEALMMRLFVKEAFRQGQLENWVSASGASTLAGLDFSSENAFIQSFNEYSDKQSEDDAEAVSSSFLEGVYKSALTPQWLINSQALMYRELTLDGDCHYMSKYANYCADLGVNADRDAGYEEILHIVQAQGIAPNDNYKALQQAIDNRALNIYQNSEEIWKPEKSTWDDWISDDVNSDVIGTTYSHEYLAAAFEAYMGVSKHNGAGLDGYKALTRDEMKAQDPDAEGWISELFHDYLQYTARIDSTGVSTFHRNQFPGSSDTPTFKMNLDDAVAGEEYTSKSQWLLNAKIIGNDTINLMANDQDNTLEGNQKDNVIDGKAGTDTYVVDADYADCTRVEAQVNSFIVECPSQGTDTLINMEKVTFKDRTLQI